MSLNRLLHQHQVAKLNAAAAETTEDRDTYRGLTGYYADRIAAWRRDEGLSETGWPGGVRKAPKAPD